MNQKIAIIIGSTRPGRAGESIAKWYLDQVKDIDDIKFEIVDLVKVNLPLLDEAIPASQVNYQNDHTKKWAETISSFDAFVWVTPEYNHAAPASLLNAISYVNKEWNRKPLALVSYGSMGGVRAAEHLRQVAGELQMVDIRPTVMIRDPWVAFDEKGDMRPELVVGSPISQIEDLLWWSKLLKTAR